MAFKADFKNATNFPIIVASWREVLPGLNKFIDEIIQPHTKQTVYSDVDEWILGSQFFKEEEDDIWKKEGLIKYGRIAKFRTSSCASGNYTWTFIKEFTLKRDVSSGVFIWEKILETK
jgi:hypothetical protein